MLPGWSRWIQKSRRRQNRPRAHCTTLNVSTFSRPLRTLAVLAKRAPALWGLAKQHCGASCTPTETRPRLRWRWLPSRQRNRRHGGRSRKSSRTVSDPARRVVTPSTDGRKGAERGRRSEGAEGSHLKRGFDGSDLVTGEREVSFLAVDRDVHEQIFVFLEGANQMILAAECDQDVFNAVGPQT